jgi:hypothetical protein
VHRGGILPGKHAKQIKAYHPFSEAIGIPRECETAFETDRDLARGKTARPHNAQVLKAAESGRYNSRLSLRERELIRQEASNLPASAS